MQHDVELSGTAQPAWRALPARARAGAPERARTWATVGAIAFAGALALLVAHGDLRVLQADGYKALYAGRWIAHHGMPHTDTLSAVHYGRSWVDAEWLAELAYYGAWRLGGYPLAAILAALCVAGTYMMLAALLRRRGISPGATMFFTAGAILGLVHWSFLRAQDLALPLFALLLVICLTDSEHPRPGRRLLLLVPLLALWANIHGSVLLGAALGTGYVLWRAVTLARGGGRRPAARCLGLACVVALTPLATPYGPGIVHYYLQFVGNPAQHVAGAEGRSPAFPGGAFFAVYIPLALVAYLVVRAIVTRRRAPGLLAAACLVTGVAASGRIGNLPWHTMVAALLIADLSRAWLPGGRPRVPALVTVTVVAASLGLAAVVTLAVRGQAGYEADTPFAAIRAGADDAARNPCSLILADNLTAAALLWHDPWLAGRIAYDARAELFSLSAMMRWATFESGRSSRWPSTIVGYRLLLGAVAFRPALVSRLAHLPHGVVLARDSRGIAVVNDAPLHRNDSETVHLNGGRCD